MVLRAFVTWWQGFCCESAIPRLDPVLVATYTDLSKWPTGLSIARIERWQDFIRPSRTKQKA